MDLPSKDICADQIARSLSRHSHAPQSTVLFATLQQAQGAADVFARPDSDGRVAAATRLVSLPLHAPPEHFFPPPVPRQPVAGAPQPQPAGHMAQPTAERPPLPPGMRAQSQPQPQPQPQPHPRQPPQQQRESIGATMRPLYAAPRPGHMVRRGLAPLLAELCLCDMLTLDISAPTVHPSSPSSNRSARCLWLPRPALTHGLRGRALRLPSCAQCPRPPGKVVQGVAAISRQGRLCRWRCLPHVMPHQTLIFCPIRAGRRSPWGRRPTPTSPSRRRPSSQPRRQP